MGSKKRYQSNEKTATNEKQVPFANGKCLSSEIPLYHLISTSLMKRLALRCAQGVANKGDKAWNAISDNQEVLTDIDFIQERIGHIIQHACLLRDRMKQYQRGDYTALTKDDDAGAIAWGAMFLCSAVDALQPE